MPQVKGTATWLTNVRQKPPEERVRLDYSSPHLENERIEEEKKQELNVIHCQQHRAMADRAYLIKEAKDAVRRYSQMQVLMKHNAVAAFLKKRREEFKKSVENANKKGDTTTTTSQDEGVSDKAGTASAKLQVRPSTSTTQRRPKSTVRRPWTAHGAPSATFFGTVPTFVETRTMQEALLRTADPKWQTMALPVSNGSRKPKRPKTSYKPRSRLEIRQSLMVEFQAKNAQGKTRARTSQGFTKGDTDDDDDLQLPSAMCPADEKQQLLQQLTSRKNRNSKKANSLHEVEKAMVRTQMIDIRQRKFAQEHVMLQQKVRNFYEGVNGLKQRTLGDRLDLIPAQRRLAFTYYK